MSNSMALFVFALTTLIAAFFLLCVIAGLRPVWEWIDAPHFEPEISTSKD